MLQSNPTKKALSPNLAPDRRNACKPKMPLCNRPGRGTLKLASRYNVYSNKYAGGEYGKAVTVTSSEGYCVVDGLVLTREWGRHVGRLPGPTHTWS